MEGSEKRLLVAVVLCIVIWIIFAPKEEHPAKKSAEEVAQKTETKIGSEDTGTLSTFPAIPDIKSTAPLHEALENYTLENNDVLFEVSNKGGLFTEIILKHYNKEHNSKENINLILQKNEKYFLPRLDIEINKQKIDDEFINGIYRVLKHDSKEIVFSKIFKNLFAIEKHYRIEDSGFIVESSYTIKNISSSLLLVNLSLAIPFEIVETKKGSFFMPTPNVAHGALIYTNHEYFHNVLGDLKPQEDKVFSGNISWLGIDDQYFVTSFIPTISKFESIHVQRGEDKKTLTWARYIEKALKENTDGKYAFNMYAGPKEINLLKSIAPNLEKSIDLGSWLGPIARPLLQLLKLIYAYVKNYGIAIIILTLLVRLLLYPINRKQYKSMKAMQKLGPELAAIKKKYATDKQRINLETMNLFKRNKVNPLGGCLPMLLQMPIFFALYRVLYNSIELRHAPFFWWIQDLSAPDPYYISPVLMAAAMFFQQKLTPTGTMDPAQAKIMKFMPIIFSIFMIALPSGLVLYILVSSLASIPQQVYMTKYNK